MYGWIIGSLVDWIQTKFGTETWHSIANMSQVDIPTEGFFRNVYYTDDTLFQIVRSASIFLNMEWDSILFLGGKHFIYYLECHGYSRTLRYQGSTFREWLHNINEPHRLLRSRFPKAIFPMLWCEPDVNDSTGKVLILHYLSKRKDVLVSLFKGILTEAAVRYFNLDINMEFVKDEIVSATDEYHAQYRLFNVDNSFKIPSMTESEVNDATTNAHEAISAPKCPFNHQEYAQTPTEYASNASNGKNTSTNTPKVGISAAIFQRMFPFHIVLDRSLHIIQVGDKLHELLEDRWGIPNVVNFPIYKNFDICSPKFIHWTWDMISKLDRSSIDIALTTILECPVTVSKTQSSNSSNEFPQTAGGEPLVEKVQVHFRGEVIVLDGADDDKIVLCLNPDITYMDQLFQLRMSLADLPVHSLQAEMLLIDEHLKTETNYTLFLKEIGVELDRETKRATKALQLKRHFVRYVSHEIRTPLNIAILGLRFMEVALSKQQAAQEEQLRVLLTQSQQSSDLTQQLIKASKHTPNRNNENNATHRVNEGKEEDDEDDESVPAVMNEVKSAVMIAVEILNDLLLYEKVDNSGFFELSQEYFDVHGLVHESVNLFKVQAKGAGVRFVVDDEQIARAENDQSLSLPCRLGHEFRHHFKKSPLSLSAALSSSFCVKSVASGSSINVHSIGADTSCTDKEEELESIIVKVDKCKTQQVLRNLFTNAVKFTRPGSCVKVSYAVFGSPELLEEHHRRLEAEQQRHLPEANDKNQPQFQNGNSDSKRMYSASSTATEKTSRIYENDSKKQSDESNNRTHDTNDDSRNNHSSSDVLSTSTDALTAERINYDIEEEQRHSCVVHFAEDTPHFPPYFVRIAVKDEGVGISDEDQRSLFHEFTQLKAEKLQNGQGSGLGLWISSTIMHLHGGRIGVMSPGEGQGSTFFIDLPVVWFEDEEEETREGDIVVRHAEESVTTEETPTTNAAIPPSLSSSALLALQGDDTNSSRSNSPNSKDTQSVGTPSNNGMSSLRPLLSPLSMQHNQHSHPDSMNGSKNTGRTGRHYDTSSRSPVSPVPAIVTSSLRTPRSAYPRSPKPSVGNNHSNHEMNGASSRLLPPLEHATFQNIRILITDDAASNRKMVRRLFQTKFQLLDDAENGKVAVEKYLASIVAAKNHNDDATNNDTTNSTNSNSSSTSTVPYGLVLMDYLMPVMDGIEATRQIKQVAHDHRYNVLVFGVTGQGLTEDVRLFKAAGADEVFMKPLDFNKLISCLETTYGLKNA